MVRILSGLRLQLGHQPARDRDTLVALMDRFLALPADAPLAPHSFFGPLTRRERERWVWAHTDHHLRQFGA